MQAGFTIEQPREDLLGSLPLAEPTDLLPVGKGLKTGGHPAAPSRKVTLAKALEIAARQSRELQNRKEQLFLSALGLTLDRHRFAPNFFGNASGSFAYKEVAETVETVDTEHSLAIEPLEGTDPPEYHLVAHSEDVTRTETKKSPERSLAGSSSLGFSWLFWTGAELTATLSSDFSKLLTGDRTKAASSLLNFSLAQPLLRGRGLAARESLTQAERSVVYDVRGYVRFLRSFFVGVASEYYRLLEQRQVVRNEQVNYENLVYARERAEMLAQAGRLPEFQVDQTRQDELAARDRLEARIESYQRALDEFKRNLALPIDALVVLDLGELGRLDVAKIEADVPALDAAIAMALAKRLDLQTSTDAVEDAERNVAVARNDLLPGLDLTLGHSTGSDYTARRPFKFDFGFSQYSAGLDLQLPLDNKSERNAYRRALISFDRSQRDHQDLHDGVVLEVRDSWRRFFRARASYEIQKTSVELARSRVDSTTMLLEAGRATTRDMLEAREDLVQAQNALARALVDYRIARMELARDMDTLRIGPDGSLEEHLSGE